LGVAGSEFRAHELGEGLNPLRGQFDGVASLHIDALKRGLGDVALVLQALDALLQISVQIDDALLNGAVEAVELLPVPGQLAFERSTALGDRGVLSGPLLDQRFENMGETLGGEQAITDIFGHQLIEFAHGNVAALADRLALLLASGAAVVGVFVLAA
jgi:hypothetical protein